MKVRFVVASLLAVAASAMAPSAQAELIVYDGFGYPDGEYLQISDGGGGVYDNLDDGVGLVYDHDNDLATPDQAPSAINSVNGDFTADGGLGAPGRNGGVGPWVTSWTKRGRTEGKADSIDGNSTLTYTDSQGNSLATTMGKPNYNGQGRFGHAYRTFDASGIAGGSLTFANDAGNYNVPRLGKQDSVVWMSFLADRSTEAEADGGQPDANWFVSMQFWNKQGAGAGGDPFVNRSAGIFREFGDGEWMFWDDANGGDPTVGSGLGDIAGGSAADDDDSNGDLFLVVKLDYSATKNDPFGGGTFTDGFADISVWVDPDLGGSGPTSSPNVTGDGYIAFNGINFFSGAAEGHKSTSSLDEIRLGTTYADVSPIENVAGIPGDFDGSGAVGNSDLTLLLDNWGEAVPPVPAGWTHDLPTPTGVGNDDLTRLLDNWGASSLTSASVPEPSTLVIALLASIGGLAFRRVG